MNNLDAEMTQSEIENKEKKSMVEDVENQINSLQLENNKLALRM